MFWLPLSSSLSAHLCIYLFSRPIYFLYNNILQYASASLAWGLFVKHVETDSLFIHLTINCPVCYWHIKGWMMFWCQDWQNMFCFFCEHMHRKPNSAINKCVDLNVLLLCCWYSRAWGLYLIHYYTIIVIIGDWIDRLDSRSRACFELCSWGAAAVVGWYEGPVSCDIFTGIHCSPCDSSHLLSTTAYDPLLNGLVICSMYVTYSPAEVHRNHFYGWQLQWTVCWGKHRELDLTLWDCIKIILLCVFSFRLFNPHCKASLKGWKSTHHSFSGAYM